MHIELIYLNEIHFDAVLSSCGVFEPKILLKEEYLWNDFDEDFEHITNHWPLICLFAESIAIIL